MRNPWDTANDDRKRDDRNESPASFIHNNPLDPD
jgi:hypothetical protein